MNKLKPEILGSSSVPDLFDDRNLDAYYYEIPNDGVDWII